MRILHVLDHSLPLHSGYTFRTASILREQGKLGWKTFHLTSPRQSGSSQAEEDAEGLHFFRTPPPTGVLGDLPLLRPWLEMRLTEQRLLGLAKTLKPDLLHAHSPVLNAIPTLRAGRRLGIPVVYEIRAFWEDAAVDHGTTREGSPRYRATRALETWALKRVDHVFTICEGLRRDIIARGISPNKMTVIPNAVDIESFQLSGEPDAALKKQLGLDGATVIGFVGSFYAYEGLDLLVDALPRLLAARPELRLLLVGGGPQEANLKAQARRLGVAERVVFAGRVPHREVSRYYDLIDLLAYPRHSMRLTELVTPLKPLEAMAQGRVFIASDVGGHQELIRDGETGRLFAAGNVAALTAAIGDMLDHQSDWPTMRLAGRRFVEEVRNWRQSVARYEAPYSRLRAQ
ncbi:TIGR04063 family PEP-CTERM/XrtA system glycosyltransferase [Thiocystis violascens]|uniref:PEP-CTERM/exosortase 1-associated glycosyltransferase, Daro_2409 family n=1 Tax=Thiocystis violascens (strain ATCC 17096 / DSM 198 / 6111) TaxID=765911 RepID=I3YFT8_THIV6|nr:TIGR04063 family PEP-CTERM/XrtA system glycosyltransferase [Thiocystis violascens]AFL75856.1 PEP-CTERM/exosortase 1-associated glycosyltransferase, Daro_2409 family [Thiocystis violascens DSM 198]